MPNNDKIYEILMEIKETGGETSARLNAIEEHLSKLNSKVAYHSSFINNLKGKMAVIIVILGFAGNLVADWIKKHV